jgi:glycosyltransferase involved in cell wall biosynthesis
MRSITSVSILDQNIVRTSPAGSCVLRIVEELAEDIPLHLFSNRAEVPESKLVRTTTIPLQPGPIVLRSVLFSLFSRACPELVGRRIRVIPNPVDIEPHQSATGGTGIQPVQFSFCALGNVERKGLRLILEAFARISDVDVHLTVIGGTTGEVRDYERLAMGDRVRFVGFQNDVRPYLLASHAFLFPSAYEVFPLVCLQAAAAGLPLLVTGAMGWRIHAGWRNGLDRRKNR